jgi:peptide deformylase
MAIREVVTFPAPVLHRKAKLVEEINDEIREILDDMLETMYSANGIGLAAPQIGVSLRMAVIDTGEPVPGREDETDTVIKFINPVIVAREGEVDFEEGCLSVPDFTHVMKRSKKLTVEFLDENGDERTIAADGLLAIAFQQEIDHLDGRLIIDEVSSLKRDMYLSKRKKADAGY